MSDELKNDSFDEVEDFNEESSTVSRLPILKKESMALIEQIISETDEQKTRDFIQLFNANQNKKTMVRVNKLNDLLDTITDQALARFTTRPDEISNKELFDGLKIVHDLIERGQKQVSGTAEAPLIQVNQQTNEVNIGGSSSSLNRDSRERVKSAVINLLNSITKPASTETQDIIIADAEEETFKDEEDTENG